MRRHRSGSDVCLLCCAGSGGARRLPGLGGPAQASAMRRSNAHHGPAGRGIGGRDHLLDTSRSLTVSAWVNLSNARGSRTLVSQRAGRGLVSSWGCATAILPSATGPPTRPERRPRWRNRDRSSPSPASGTSSRGCTALFGGRSRSTSTAASRRHGRCPALDGPLRQQPSPTIPAAASEPTSLRRGSRSCVPTDRCWGRARIVRLAGPGELSRRRRGCRSGDQLHAVRRVSRRDQSRR